MEGTFLEVLLSVSQQSLKDILLPPAAAQIFSESPAAAVRTSQIIQQTREAEFSETKHHLDPPWKQNFLLTDSHVNTSAASLAEQESVGENRKCVSWSEFAFKCEMLWCKNIPSRSYIPADRSRTLRLQQHSSCWETMGSQRATPPASLTRSWGKQVHWKKVSTTWPNIVRLIIPETAADMRRISASVLHMCRFVSVNHPSTEFIEFLLKWTSFFISYWFIND